MSELRDRRKEVHAWMQRATDWVGKIESAEPTPTDYQVDRFYRDWNNLPPRLDNEPLFTWVQPRTWEPWAWAGPGAPPTAINPGSIQAICAKLGITNVAGFRAIIDVETNGQAWTPSGNLAVLFEGHYFWHYLGVFGLDRVSLAKSHPTIVYPTQTNRFYLGGDREYTRVREAIKIHATAAKLSASWGLGQIMGANHGMLGFGSVEEFIRFSAKSLDNQLECIGRYLRGANLIGPLNLKDYHAVARGYNGPNYAAHGYHTKLSNRAAFYGG